MVNFMNVYCKFVSVDGNKVTYMIGNFTNDITGIIVIDYVEKKYDIIKQPEKEDVCTRHVDSMLLKYQPLFEKGEFPEKMSREIG